MPSIEDMSNRRGRTLRAAVLALVLLTAASAAAAQARPEPRLVFSIFVGVAGAGDLWTVRGQPLTAPVPNPPEPDTIALGRMFSTGLIAGLSTTLFKSAHLGISGEAVYIGLLTDSDCAITYESTPIDFQARNRQVCEDITRQQRTVSFVGFFLGGTYRFAARGALSPYVRLQGGVTVRSSSLVETSGQFTAEGRTSVRGVFVPRTTTAVRPSAVVGAGFMIPMAPGYALRLELADHLIPMDRVTGPSQLADPPTARFLDHVPALTVSLDIVLEQRRGRRY
jgi:hypothetical protein